MKQRIILTAYAFMVSICFMTACNSNPSKNSETASDSIVNKNLDAVFNNYWEQRIKLLPFQATMTGDVRIIANDRIATAWVPYNILVNEKISHQGVKIFTMAKSGKRWLITTMNDSK